MKKTIYSIYNYYDTLLSQWSEWNSDILIGNFDDSASNLTEALEIETSDGRSRAKEMYRIGLLKYELTKGDKALSLIKQGQNIQSDLGFISALIYREYISHPTDNLYSAIAAINSIFAILQSISIGDISISINTLINKLLDEFPKPSNIDVNVWIRYTLSGFFCEFDYAEDEQLNAIHDFLLGESSNITFRIISIDKNKNVTIRGQFSNSQELSKLIEDGVSLTNILQQKRPLFIMGTPKDEKPRGFYGIAFKMFPDFLQTCAHLEYGNETNSPFKQLYNDDESPNSLKDEALSFLYEFSKQNNNFKTSFSKIMKTIETGAIEALSRITSKPVDFFYKKLIQTGENADFFFKVLAAIRTKPFILLAGISGTGKSRIVRELAFKSCPEYLQDKEGVSPGNYCMIEVKPNWHDSTELLGYYSNLSNGYQFKKFVKFLVKAKMYPDVPFFVCLDEMNLAPVEQYFAEILSVLETRKHPISVETGEVDMKNITTGTIVEARFFKELCEIKGAKNPENGETYKQKLSDKEIYMKLFEISQEDSIKEEIGNRTDLTNIGLTLPDNVVIIGTVNMDDTTHQFSRKVIDRAMTIEMNGGNLRDMFGGSKKLEYLPKEEQEKWQKAFTCRYVTADEVLEAHPEYAGDIVEKLPQRLEDINRALKGTPFEVSYRVLNELTIMVGVMLDNNEEGAELDNIINQAINNILLMKILPRIEGDAEMFELSNDYKRRIGVNFDNRLEWLKYLAPKLQEVPEDTTPEEKDGSAEETTENERIEHQQTAADKIQEMIDRLDNQDFTRFWP